MNRSKQTKEQVNLEVGLKRNCLQIKPEGLSTGELVLVVENKSQDPVDCDRIRIQIPYGDEKDQKALTPSNDFPASINGDWTLNNAPSYRVNKAQDALLIDEFNDYSSISVNEVLESFFFNIPINPNPEGQDQRVVVLKVEFYNTVDEQETVIFKRRSKKRRTNNRCHLIRRESLP